MKRIIFFLLLFFFITNIKSQEISTDTLSEKITDIEKVIINDKDYEKIDYTFALKKEINYKLKSVNPASAYEMGLRFNNNLNRTGRISAVTLFLHKTDSQEELANLEINFYRIDTISNKPLEKLNKQQIIYSPTTKKRGNVKINVENYHIPFPQEGIVITVKWLPINGNWKNVGPAIRLTNYTENLTYTRYNNDDSKWSLGPNLSKKNGLYTNVMIGLDVYIKRRKNNE